MASFDVDLPLGEEIRQDATQLYRCHKCMAVRAKSDSISTIELSKASGHSDLNKTLHPCFLPPIWALPHKGTCDITTRFTPAESNSTRQKQGNTPRHTGTAPHWLWPRACLTAKPTCHGSPDSTRQKPVYRNPP